jgi:LysR family hydrogen peroxide-inducible transcriptional activator
MEVCHLVDRDQTGEMGDLRAASLETLLHLVGAGFGCTLVPALAIRGGWMTDTGIIARRLDLPDACRRISLVFRRSFPRRPALDAFAGVIRDHLPNTVRPLPTPQD